MHDEHDDESYRATVARWAAIPARLTRADFVRLYHAVETILPSFQRSKQRNRASPGSRPPSSSTPDDAGGP